MATFRLLRHATLMLDPGGATFPVDPTFAPAGSLQAVPRTPNQAPDRDEVAAALGEHGPDVAVGVHLEAFDHCVLTRRALRAAIGDRRIVVPDDGEALAL